MVRVKICGITNPEDARLAVDAGAEAIGLVFAESPRQVDVETAARVAASVPPFVTVVGVFVDEPTARIVEICRRTGIGTAQLSGTESAEDTRFLRNEGLRVIKALHVTPGGALDAQSRYAGAHAVLLDTRTAGRMGGTGVAFDCTDLRASDFDVPVILAGGLSPENVEERVRAVEPYAVDVSSGVEASPGRKDPEKLLQFVCHAKRAHETA